MESFFKWKWCKTKRTSEKLQKLLFVVKKTQHHLPKQQCFASPKSLGQKVLSRKTFFPIYILRRRNKQWHPALLIEVICVRLFYLFPKNQQQLRIDNCWWKPSQSGEGQVSKTKSFYCLKVRLQYRRRALYDQCLTKKELHSYYRTSSKARYDETIKTAISYSPRRYFFLGIFSCFPDVVRQF